MKTFVSLQSNVPSLDLQPSLFKRIASRYPQLKLEFVDQAQLRDRIGEVEIAVVWEFPAELFAYAGKLRAVFTPVAGKDWVAEDPAGRVPVFYGEFHGWMIAESLLAMVLHFNNCHREMLQCQVRRIWDRAVQARRRLLSGQEVLIVGYGRIGRFCAQRMHGLGCHVTGIRRRPAGCVDELGVRLAPWRDMGLHLGRADHVVLLLPGNANTQGLITGHHLAAMRENAYLYNLGRGTVICEADLVQALVQGSIAGAGLDVFEREPLSPDSPLWRLDNVLLTPHSACCYKEYGRLFAEELKGKLGTVL